MSSQKFLLSGKKEGNHPNLKGCGELGGCTKKSEKNHWGFVRRRDVPLNVVWEFQQTPSIIKKNGGGIYYEKKSK